MIDRFIEKSVRSWGLVIFLTTIAAASGWMALQSLPIDAVPDITNVQVQVNTAVEGLVPEEIEKLVTFPIESQLGGIPGVQTARSISRFGLSQITLVFEEGTDIFRARQLVSERLSGVTAELPAGVEPTLGPITTGLGEIFFYSLDAKERAIEPAARLRQLQDLRALQEWFLEPRLLTVKGVAEVNAIGGFEKQFYVKPRLQDLARYGLHLEEIVEAIRRNNRNTGGGYIQQTAEQLLIQADGLVRSLDDLRSITVKRLANFRAVKVGDIADVGTDRELRTGAALVDGEEVVVGTILMLMGENSRTVSSAVAQRIEEVRGSLPDWVKLEILYNRSDLVNATLGTVERNLLFGASLVAIILLVIIGNARVALITAITIPLALLCTFIFMRFFGVSGNLMSLGALDFGIIIDGAVIVMDNCVRLVQRRAREAGRTLSREEVREEVIRATREIRSAAGFGQMIILIVFLPIFALTGVEAKMFAPMAATFCFALGSAFIFSFSTVPALAGSFLSGKPSERRPWLMDQLERAYRPMIEAALRRRRVFVFSGVGAILLGAALFARLGSDFLPQLDEGSIAIQFVRPTNISIDQSVAMQSLSEKAIREFPEVSRVLSRIGTAEVATDPMGVNLSDTYILLKPYADWPRIDGKRRDKAGLVAAIQSKLEESIPGQSLIFSQPIQLRFNELLEGVRADVALKIYGEDLDELGRLASGAAAIIRKVSGAGDVEEESKGKSPVLKVSPDALALGRLGASKEEVLSTVETAIGGTEAGRLFEGVNRFPIIVRLSESDRSSLESIRQVPVGVGDSQTLPLVQVARVAVEETHADIRRESAKKRAAVLVNVRGRDTASFVEEARGAVASGLKLPTGYYLEWGGSFRNLEQARQRLAWVVPLALLLVFAMIFMAFRSLAQTLMIFACIPMALVGGVLGLMLNGLHFSISAAIGFIALSGIAVLNGIVLVSYFNRLKIEGLSGDELILRGTAMRLRPVLMTALAAAFGFLPMMFSSGSGAEVQRPLAAVVVGGIVSATALTLVVLPVIYRLMEGRMKVVDSKMAH